jgi:very-short-patch-repair endonuclease
VAGLEQTRGSATRIARLADGQHGVVARRQLLAIGLSDDVIEVQLRQGTRADSTLEERFLAFIDFHRLLRPNLNVWITLPDRRYKADCLWPDRRQIVELDSWQTHGTHSAFHSDRSRNRRLEAAGYRVTLVTSRHRDREPAVLAGDLRALLTN